MKEFPKLLIYNTLSGEEEEFKPVHPGHVSMYCCGVTVYAPCHVGHARAFIVFDVIYRFLQSLGYKVKFVRNFTDIDDKIINKAHEREMASIELAQENIHFFHEDARSLKLRPPTEEPRATEHIEEIVELIEKLIEKDFAYDVDGEIFFSVKKFKDYGKLSGKNIEELQAGARIEIGEKKKDPLDFVLWKPSKEGEPSWNTPRGGGRPGWHIECSAMSQKYLGKTFDIHGGGADLIFPHHENEIAQSEAAYDVPFATYWVHNGLVNLGKEKMSKSLGNIVTVNEFLKKYSAEVLRMWVLASHYRSPLGFSPAHIKDAVIRLERFYRTKELIENIVDMSPPHEPVSPTEEEKALLTEVKMLSTRFQEAMLDDFNSSQALGVVFEVIRKLNQYLQKKNFKESTLTRDILKEARNTFTHIAEIWGVFEEAPKTYLPKLYEQLLPSTITKEYIESRIAERKLAREAKNWKLSDQIRDELGTHNIVLEDASRGTTWRVSLPND